MILSEDLRRNKLPTAHFCDPPCCEHQSGGSLPVSVSHGSLAVNGCFSKLKYIVNDCFSVAYHRILLPKYCLSCMRVCSLPNMKWIRCNL